MAVSIKPGVYIIFSIAKPHKFYVGSSVNVFRRWKIHLKKLSSGTHENTHLQNHFNKYGKSDLYFLPFIFCSKHDLLRLEQLAINSMQPTFNICKIASNRLGVKGSQKTRSKLQQAWQHRSRLSWYYRP